MALVTPYSCRAGVAQPVRTHFSFTPTLPRRMQRGCRVHTFRAKAEQQDVHEDIPDNIKQFVRRTFSTKELASQLVAPPETPLPNQHVGYINGVLHVFDESIPNDPALSEDFARARDTLIAASRQSQQRQQQQQANGLNNVTPLDNGVPIPNSSVALSAAATPVPTGSPGSSAFLTPPQLYYKVAETGQSKVTLPFGKVLLLGVLAGVYTAFGATLALSVGGNCPGLAAVNPGLQKALFGLYGLPFGAMMAVICGAELFTGNTGFYAAALFENQVSGKQVAEAGLASYVGNALGAAFMVTLVAMSGIFAVSAAGPIAIAMAKVSLPWQQAFVRGILCNWLLSLAMWQAAAATSVVGKAVATLVPISAFVTCGFEHSIANMFFVPLGIVLGAPITPLQFLLHNLIPVTLGNIVGGTLCCSLSYSCGFGSVGNRMARFSRQST